MSASVASGGSAAARQSLADVDPVERLLARHRPIDCDLHVAVPDNGVLLPYFEDYWREQITMRGIDRQPLDLTSYPPNAAISVRPDWRPASGRPGSDLSTVQRQALDPFHSRLAIINCLHGSMVLHSEDMAAAFARAINDWVAKEWLDRDPRLRASIVVSAESPQLAIEEIERRAGDTRFVQVLLLAMGELPLGRRFYWPLYEVAEHHGLPIGIHAGSSYRHAPTGIGWPSYHLEEYVGQSAGFESQLLSLVSEGAFAKFPKLKVVLMESGFMWLPAFMWRADKTWRGVRPEVPWVKEAPSDILRAHMRLTIQPVDTPPQPEQFERVIEQIGCDDMLLFATDYPHWQFDGMDVLPPALAGARAARVLVENALKTYPRLTGEPKETTP
ncbi:MAG: amidohydrolase family protein [Variibacter sp.]